MEWNTSSEHITQRQSIRALEAEIDEAYGELQGHSVMVKGVGQDSPKAFSYTQSPRTAPRADPTDRESLLATYVPSTFVGPLSSRTDASTCNITVQSRQGLLQASSRTDASTCNITVQSRQGLLQASSRTDASNITVPSRQGLLQACSRTDASNITVPRRQGLFQVGNSEQRKVAFDKDVKNVYVPTSMCSDPMYTSAPRFSKKRMFPPPPSYHSRADKTCAASTQISLREPKPVVMPESYDGVLMTSEYWLTNFEICSEINSWSESQKCSFLAVKLRGAVLHVYTDLPAEKSNKYISVVQSLRNRFDRSNQTELYKVQLRARVRKSGENLSELASAVRRLTNRAYPGVTVEVRQDLAKDHFIEASDSRHTRLQIRQRKPSSLVFNS